MMSSLSGPYVKACARLAASGFQLHWQSAPVGHCVKGKRMNKTEFTVRNVGETPWQNLTPSCSAAPVWLNINNYKLCSLNSATRHVLLTYSERNEAHSLSKSR